MIRELSIPLAQRGKLATELATRLDRRCARSAGFQPAVSRTSSPQRVDIVEYACGLETRDTPGWKPALRVSRRGAFGTAWERSGSGSAKAHSANAGGRPALLPEKTARRRRTPTRFALLGGFKLSGRILSFLVLLLLMLSLGTDSALGQTNTSGGVSLPGGFVPLKLNLGFEAAQQPQDVDIGIKILFAITLLTLAPSIIMLMTSFTRIVVVLSFVRSALSLQGTPANQILIGLSLFLTYFIMEPVWSQIDSRALKPYLAKEISSDQALDEAAKPIRSFMLRQTRPKDLELFVGLAKLDPTSPELLPLKVVIPAFITSELRTAFQMGFLLFVPFLLIDLVVATVLMSMGMMMMPPAAISLPLKILLFILVDGWNLVIHSLALSFGG